MAVPVGSGGPANLGKGPGMPVAGSQVAPVLPAALPVDAAKLALAREAMKAMQAERMLESLSNQLKMMTAQQTTLLLPTTATEEQKARLAQIQTEVTDLVREAAKAQMEKMATVYAEVFTAEELQAMRAFFVSPEGRALLSKQPLLAQRLMPLTRAMQMELMPKIGATIDKAKQELSPAPVAVPPPASAAPTPGAPAPIKITLP